MQIVVKFNDSMVTQVESDKSEVTIGRDPEADIQIDNISVSRIHAKIIIKDILKKKVSNPGS